MGSGILSTIGLILIVSNQWDILNTADSISLILFFNWQVWGVTLAKCGIDQTLFAIVSKDNRLTIKISPFLYSKAIPIAFIYTLMISFLFSFLQVITIFVTIILDTMSLIIISELNGRKCYVQSALANYLNYPLFFILLFITSVFIDINFHFTILIFLFTSLIRIIWLLFHRNQYRGNKKIVSKIDYQMGTQQILNYLMFRADQLLISILIAGKQITIIGYSVEEYLYLAKFPELIARIVVYIGIVLFPKLFISYPVINKKIFNLKSLQFQVGIIISL